MPSSLSSLEDQVVRILARYPKPRSAAMPILHLIQETQGFISKEAMEWVAARLDLQPAQILELVTFYPMFRQHPVGRNHLKICRTLPCALMGAESLRDHLLRKLGVKLDETTPDGRFTVSEVECLACCGSAPVLMVNDDLHENITPEKLEQILAACL
ncbi:MAG: NADH-quinone oxidoreductase subunit NuoE [Verrucomicrobiae bacterium]|nr:NADH-quinone oxidoreductase subunit NuoE [Verrucomicrobiae bacterium]